MSTPGAATWQRGLVRVHPGGFRVVLVGPKVSRVLPFLQGHGFVGDAYVGGAEGLAAIRAAPCHVLLTELELGDMMGLDLVRMGRSEGIVGASLLLEDPIKSGMILSALARGVDSFVPTPPDQAVLLGKLEQLLLAQWGLAVTGQQQALTDEIGRLRAALADAEASVVAARANVDDERAAGEKALRDVERHLGDERKKVRQLVSEIASLRDQLSTMHLLTGAKTGISDEGAAAAAVDDGLVEEDTDGHRSWEIAPTRNGISDADGEFENARTMALPAGPAQQALLDGGRTLAENKKAFMSFDSEPGTAPHVPLAQSFATNDEATSPGGHLLPVDDVRAAALPETRTNVGMDVSMLRELQRMPVTANEEEIIFVEDD
jgi:hypothetical protein